MATEPVTTAAVADPEAATPPSTPRRQPPQTRPQPLASELEEADRQVLLARISARSEDVEALLREKEELVLGYVFRGVPMPYYKRWKEEANNVFAALVSIKRRRVNAARRPR